ncbi:hypothetical protein ILUMI_18158, partial [Ignelater luminosus]
CYPSHETVVVSKRSAKIQLQNLLDHTLSRMLLTRREVLDSIALVDVSDELTLLRKWGCDGSTCHSDNDISTDPQSKTSDDSTDDDND